MVYNCITPLPTFGPNVSSRYRTPVLIINFFYQIYSLCKNNAISKVLNKLQAFYFRSTVYTNTKPTVIIHSYVLQKPSFCNDNGYKFELMLLDQIVTSVRFCQKKVKC